MKLYEYLFVLVCEDEFGELTQIKRQRLERWRGEFNG